MAVLPAALALALLAADGPLDRRLLAAGYSRAAVTHTADGWHARVQVGGREATAYLDTGAGESAVDADAVPRLTDARVFVTGWRTPLGPLRFGPLRLPGLSASVLDMRPVAVAGRQDLLIGTDVFQAGRAVFDFGAGRLYLRPADRPPPADFHAGLARSLTAAGFVAVPVVESAVSRMRYVRAVVSGRIVCLVVDSGSWNDTLFVDAARRLEFDPSPAAGGTHPTLAGRADVFEPVRADFRLGDAPLVRGHLFGVLGRPSPWAIQEPDDLRFDGLLGRPTLAATRAVYDVAGRTLFVARPAARWAELVGRWAVAGEREDGFCGGLLGERVTLGPDRLLARRRGKPVVFPVSPDPLGRPDCLTLTCPDLGALGLRFHTDGADLVLALGCHPAEGEDGTTTVTLRRVAPD